MSAKKAPDRAAQAEEAARGRIIGVLGVLAALVSFAAVIVQLSALDPDIKGAAAEFRKFDEDQSLAMLGTGLRIVSLALLIPMGLFIVELVRRREPTVPSFVRPLCFIAPGLFILVAVLNFFAFESAVNDFLDLPGAERTNESAEELQEEALLRIADVSVYVAGAVFGIWLASLCAACVAVGLMPRFLAYYGYAVAALGVFAPIISGPLLVGWIASVAMLLLDRWPGGRPPSWDSGRAEPLTW